MKAETVVFFEDMSKLVGMYEDQSTGKISDVMKSESEMKEE